MGVIYILQKLNLEDIELCLMKKQFLYQIQKVKVKVQIFVLLKLEDLMERSITSKNTEIEICGDRTDTVKKELIETEKEERMILEEEMIVTEERIETEIEVVVEGESPIQLIFATD